MRCVNSRVYRTGGLTLALLAVLGVTYAARAQAPASRNGGFSEPVYRVNRGQPPAARVAPQPATGAAAAQPIVNQQPAPAQEHPLMPALRIATEALAHIDRDIQDYTCTLVKQENINGKLMPREHMFAKIRHKPFSVYMYFLGPSDVKGRECLYVANNPNPKRNKLIAHEGSGLITKTLRLDPAGFLATRGNRYPITEVGIRTLTVRLIEVAKNDLQFGECDVKFFQGTKVDGRSCTCIQVVHPIRRKQFRFHLARVFVDDELRVPIRYEAYQWPTTPGGKPVLDEEYTYTNLKINQGLTDADFNEHEATYNFH